MTSMTPADAISSALDPSLRAWLDDAAGSTLTGATRLPGGGRKQAWLVDFADGRGLFLRWDRSDPSAHHDPWTVRREAEVYRGLTGTGLPVAQFVALHPTQEALLLTRVSGDAAFGAIRDPSARVAVAEDFMGKLAQLHRLDLAELKMDGFDPQTSAADCAIAQLDEMQRLIDARGGTPDPLLALALRWLRAYVPSYDGPTVVVQGDTGPGNFLHDGVSCTAIVDWELAHPGDPMDDIAWVSLRSAQDPFGDLDHLNGVYARASGHAIDADRIRYYRVLAEAKILTMSHGSDTSANAAAGRDVGAGIIFGQLHRRLTLESLADVVGIALPAIEVPPPAAADDVQVLLGTVLSSLRDEVGPKVAEPFASRRLKGAARILKYVAEVTRNRAAFDALELDALAGILGKRPTDTRSGRDALARAIAAGTVSDADALHACAVRVALGNELAREASGALADRHYAPIGAST